MNQLEPICILLLEDSPLDQFLIREALSRVLPANCQLLETDRLSEALVLLREKPIQLVLSDLNLPDSFGVATLRSLIRESNGVPVWVLTGDNDPRIARQLVQEGACGCLCKDHLSSPALQQAMDSAMHHKHACD